MRSERVGLVFAAAPLAVLVMSSTPAWGQTTAARLEVDAQPSCSTQEELIARVLVRSTRIRFVADGAGVPSMTARIAPGPKGQVVAELTVVEPDGRKFGRRLEAPSCAAATDALALVVAITLDPSAAAAEAAASPDSAAAPQTTAVPPAATPPEAPAVETGRPAGAVDAEANADTAPWTRHLTAGIAGTVVTGAAPTVMPGVALEVQGALEHGSVWSPAAILTFAHVWTGPASELGGFAEFSLDLLGLEVCPMRVAMGRLEARPCAAAALGRLVAQGSMTYDPRSAARPIATAGGTARLAFRVWSRVEVRARFGAGATLWRDAFEFTPDVFHKVASVTLVGDLGIGVRF